MEVNNVFSWKDIDIVDAYLLFTKLDITALLLAVMRIPRNIGFRGFHPMVIPIKLKSTVQAWAANIRRHSFQLISNKLLIGNGTLSFLHFRSGEMQIRTTRHKNGPYWSLRTMASEWKLRLVIRSLFFFVRSFGSLSKEWHMVIV